MDRSKLRMRAEKQVKKEPADVGEAHGMSAEEMVKTIHEENFMRSTMEPSTRATVMPAKVIWKRANTKVGMLPDRLFTPMPAMNKCSKPPMMPPWLDPKARV